MESLLNGAGAANPEELPFTPSASNLWNVKKGKIAFGLGLGPHCVPKKPVCRDNTKTVIMTTGLETKSIV